MNEQKIPETPQEFLDQLLKDRRAHMMGVVHDLAYYTQVIKELEEGKSEEDLRTELADENKKRVMDKKGKRVIADTRDLEKVKEISEKINKITNFKQQLTKVIAVGKDLTRYIDYAKKAKDDTELISKMEGVLK